MTISKPDPFVIELDAPVRGFGVRFAPCQRGDVWRLRVSNRAYGHQTYAPSGRFAVGNHTYLLDSPGEDLVEYRPPDARDVLRITPADERSMLTVSDALAPRRATAAPQWALGTWLSGTWVGLTQARVEADLAQLEASDLSFVGRIIDGPWHGYSEQLLSPSDRFPDLEGLIRRHLEAGLEVALWLAPHVLVNTPQWDAFARRGWFVTDGFGAPLVFPVVGAADLWGSYPDLTLTDARAAWVEAVARLRALGVRAIKLDFGEALPSDSELAMEITGARRAWRSRNLYPLALQTATVDGLGPDGFVIARSGWTGSEGLVANWVGDQSSDLSRFAGLMSTAWALRSAVDSGYTTVGLDIGGYFGHPSAEAFTSWQRTAALFDVGMYHGLTERAPWRRGSRAVAEHKRLSSLPGDRWEGGSTVTVTRSAEGLAIVQRASDKVVAVADLAEPAAVILPAGMWASIDSGQVFEGDRVTACDPGEVFVRHDN